MSEFVSRATRATDTKELESYPEEGATFNNLAWDKVSKQSGSLEEFQRVWHASAENKKEDGKGKTRNKPRQHMRSCEGAGQTCMEPWKDMLHATATPKIFIVFHFIHMNTTFAQMNYE